MQLMEAFKGLKNRKDVVPFYICKNKQFKFLTYGRTLGWNNNISAHNTHIPMCIRAIGCSNHSAFTVTTVLYVDLPHGHYRQND